MFALILKKMLPRNNKFMRIKGILLLAITASLLCFKSYSTTTLVNPWNYSEVHRQGDEKSKESALGNFGDIKSDDEDSVTIGSNRENTGGRKIIPQTSVMSTHHSFADKASVHSDMETHEIHLENEKLVQSTGNDKDLCIPKIPQLSRSPRPRTALASFMGSGNTWTRHLIQQMSGIATSAIYCDKHLTNNGFPYECYRNRSRVAVVKTHRARNSNMYDQAVLILRNPFDTFISALNWRYAGHVKHTDDAKIRERIEENLDRFITTYKGLVNAFVKYFKGPVLVLQYEHLKSNLTNTLPELATFLNIDVSQRDIECTVHLQTGNFHRQTDPSARKLLLLDVYDSEKENKIYNAMVDVETTLQDRLHKPFKIIKSLRELMTLEL